LQLQIAFDTFDSQTVESMVDQIFDVVDIIEIGTPMIIHEGVRPVERIKRKYPCLTLLADTKIMDGGEIEARYAFDAGADIVTVLGLAPYETVSAVVDVANSYGRKCMADMLCTQQIVKKAVKLVDLGVNYICLHTAKDEQTKKKAPLEELRDVKGHLKRSQIAIAGGVNLDILPSIIEIGAEIVVVGSALTNAPDLRKAVLEMKAAIM